MAPDPRIRVIPETGSTNADLRALVASGWPDGQWLRAERQTAGRGRQGRNWESPAGNLFASTLIRLRPDDPPVAGLALVLGVAVHAGLAALLPAAPIRLKWPNDVMAGEAKLVGMLLEREGDGVIAGVGVNVTQAPPLPDRKTASLADLAGGRAPDAMQVLEAIMAALDHWLAVWRGEGMAAIVEAWCARAHPVGTRLAVRTGTGTDLPQQGDFLGLDRDGALILGLDDGTRAIIHSGDVGVLA